MNARRQQIVILVLVFAALLLLGVNSSRFFFRADLTEDRAFSISKVSRELFREIPQTVHLTYFVSDRLRSLTPVPGQIIDLLNEYATYSHGRIRVTIEDPVRQGTVEAARRFGIVPQQVQVIEQNEQRVSEVYSGLVIEYLDRSLAVPFVFNPDTLEYSLTLSIRRIVRNSEGVVGVLIADPAKSLERNFTMLVGQLSLSFRVKPVPPGEEIPEGIRVLVVIGGTGLSREQVRPIARFVAKGGHALFAVKGLHVATERDLSATPVVSSPLLKLLATYGVRVGTEMVLDQSARDYRLPQIVFGTLKWQVIGKYPEWVSILPQDVSPSNPITRRFPGLDLLWPTSLTVTSVPGVGVERLVTTSPDAWLMAPPYVTNPFRVVGMGTSVATRGRYLLAAALTGRFPAGADSRIIVVSDSDFASDLAKFSDSPYNALFLENAVEWLSSDSDLLAIKTRNFREARLNRIQKPEARSRAIIVAEIVNLAFVPLLVVAAGVLRVYFRRESLLVARSKRKTG